MFFWGIFLSEVIRLWLTGWLIKCRINFSFWHLNPDSQEFRNPGRRTEVVPKKEFEQNDSQKEIFFIVKNLVTSKSKSNFQSYYKNSHSNHFNKGEIISASQNSWSKTRIFAAQLLWKSVSSKSGENMKITVNIKVNKKICHLIVSPSKWLRSLIKRRIVLYWLTCPFYLDKKEEHFYQGQKKLLNLCFVFQSKTLFM